MPRSRPFSYTTLFRSDFFEDVVHHVAEHGPAQRIVAVNRSGGLVVGERRVVAVACPLADLRQMMPGHARERTHVNAPLADARSEEHTSELQSLRHLVCRDLDRFPTRRSSDLISSRTLCTMSPNTGPRSGSSPSTGAAASSLASGASSP